MIVARKVEPRRQKCVLKHVVSVVPIADVSSDEPKYDLFISPDEDFESCALTGGSAGRERLIALRFGTTHGVSSTRLFTTIASNSCL